MVLLEFLSMILAIGWTCSFPTAKINRSSVCFLRSTWKPVNLNLLRVKASDLSRYCMCVKMNKLINESNPLLTHIIRNFAIPWQIQQPQLLQQYFYPCNTRTHKTHQIEEVRYAWQQHLLSNITCWNFLLNIIHEHMVQKYMCTTCGVSWMIQIYRYCYRHRHLMLQKIVNLLVTPYGFVSLPHHMLLWYFSDFH